MYVKLSAIAAVCFSSLLLPAQDRDRDRDRDYRDRGAPITVLEPGTVIPVRLNDAIDVERSDRRVYTGITDQDVRGDNGRIAIPRGSAVELAVRTAPDNDLIIDFESVVSNGQRYAVRTEPKRIESRHDDSLVGSIVGAIQGGQARGRAVRVPRDTVVVFRLERALSMGVADRGYMRDGYHYHGDDRDPRDR